MIANVVAEVYETPGGVACSASENSGELTIDDGKQTGYEIDLQP